MSNFDVAVIGAGWAGAACARALTEAGRSVVVFEANAYPGGRARRVDHPELGAIDNGQHLLLGAYTETLALIHRYAPKANLDARPFSWRMNTRAVAPNFKPAKGESVASSLLYIPPSRLPGRLKLAASLLQTKGWPWTTRRAFTRWLNHWQKQDMQCDINHTVADISRELPRRVTDFFLHPLCLAALNTPAAAASAQVFLNVLGASLLGSSRATELHFPREDLTAVFPEPVLSHSGLDVRLAQAVIEIERGAGTFRIVSRKSEARVQALVLAVSPSHLTGFANVLPSLSATAHQLNQLEYAPISTVHVKLRALPVGLAPRGMLALLHPTLQWLVADSKPDADGLWGARIVVSGSSAHAHHSIETLESVCFDVLRRGGLTPAIIRAVTEKRATYHCTPQAHALLRALPHPPAPLFIAGDFCYPAFPATLEAAVRSGLKAAKNVNEFLKT